MRTLSVLFLLVVFMASVASAEMLTTANPIGKGRFAIEGFGYQDQNLTGDSDLTATTYGGYVGYGILDDLDAYLSYGISNVAGLPGAGMGNYKMSGSGASLALKKRLLKEGAGMPVSVAAALQYKITSLKASNDAWDPVLGFTIPASDTTTPGTEIIIGVGCSKVIIPFVPYGGLAYRTTSSDGSEASTQIDITLGTAIAWSEQGAVLIEYTSQSITPKAAGVAVYTSGQIAAGIGYKI